MPRCGGGSLRDLLHGGDQHQLAQGGAAAPLDGLAWLPPRPPAAAPGRAAAAAFLGGGAAARGAPLRCVALPGPGPAAPPHWMPISRPCRAAATAFPPRARGAPREPGADALLREAPGAAAGRGLAPGGPPRGAAATAFGLRALDELKELGADITQAVSEAEGMDEEASWVQVQAQHAERIAARSSMLTKGAVALAVCTVAAECVNGWYNWSTLKRSDQQCKDELAQVAPEWRARAAAALGGGPSAAGEARD